MLDEAQRAELDRLWDELHFVSQDALTLVDAFAQLMEYATQDSDPKVFEPLRKPINDRAAAFRKRLVDDRAAAARRAGRVRGPGLSPAADRRRGRRAARACIARLRSEEMPHDEAIRLTLARVLVVAGVSLPGREAAAGPAGRRPVSDWELASRLSYFLWSSHARR